MLSVVIQAIKRSVMFLCTPFPNFCFIYSDWASPCIAHQPDWIHPVQIHLITALSVINRLSLYEFTLWGRDLESVVCIRESRHYIVY